MKEVFGRKNDGKRNLLTKNDTKTFFLLKRLGATTKKFRVSSITFQKYFPLPNVAGLLYDLWHYISFFFRLFSPHRWGFSHLPGRFSWSHEIIQTFHYNHPQ